MRDTRTGAGNSVVKRLRTLTQSVPLFGVYVGIVLIVAGFGLIAYGWGKVAGLTHLSLQIPYFASTAFPGLGLIICGVIIVGSSTRSRDATIHREQLIELAERIRDVREAIVSATGDMDGGS